MEMMTAAKKAEKKVDTRAVMSAAERAATLADEKAAGTVVSLAE